MTRKPDDWMPLHIGKYLANTSHLTRDQHGAYLLLLMAYWTNGGPLDAIDAQLAATVRATPAEWRKLRPVIARFFLEQDGKWHQKRADEELAKARAKQEAKARAGAKGAANRWQADGSANSTPMADASVSDRQTDAPLPSPLPTTKIEKEPLTSFGVSPPPEKPPAQSPVPKTEEPEQPEFLDRTDERKALDAYNTLASEMDWPEAQKLTDTRRRQIRARLRDGGGLAGWHGAMAKARASPFLRGELARTKGHESWVPNLDFFLRESSFTKLMEGAYDQRAGNAEPTGFSAVVEGLRRATAGGGRPN